MPHTLALRNFDFVNRSDKGLERKKNEDYSAYFDTLNGHVFVVCDGMGGHAKGEIASETAVEAIGKFFNLSYYKNPFTAVENAIIFANKKVYERSKTTPEFHNMGTTIVMVLIRDNRVFYGHVGDSRLYIYKKNNIRLLTRDHSYVNKLVDEKKITEKEALTHPLRNEITRALGLFPGVEPEVSNAAFIPKEGDILLLCTDGLSNMVQDENIEKILAGKESIDAKANKLLQSALDAGGIDNITFQLIRFYNVSTVYEPQKLQKSVFTKKYLNQLLLPAIIILTGLVFAFLFITKNKSGNKPKTIQKISYTYKSHGVIIFPYKYNTEETLEQIAEKFNIDTGYLKLLNPNINNSLKGKHIKIPIQNLHIIQANENLKDLCWQYNITMEELMQANDFCTMKIPVGKELIIPLADK